MKKILLCLLGVYLLIAISSHPKSYAILGDASSPVPVAWAAPGLATSPSHTAPCRSSSALPSSARPAHVSSPSSSVPYIPATLPQRQSPTPSEVKSYIESASLALGVNPHLATWIVGHESQDGQNLDGDNGMSHGYWMISSIWHPEVPKACADDLVCSTDWSLHWILAGHVDEWTTYRYCRVWYSDCPF